MFANFFSDIPEVHVRDTTYKTGVDYSVTLSCRIIKASPAISRVYWQRFINNATTVLSSDSTGYTGSTIEDPSLTILSAKETMSGEYTCFAINAVGTGSSFPTTLKGTSTVFDLFKRNKNFMNWNIDFENRSYAVLECEMKIG